MREQQKDDDDLFAVGWLVGECGVCFIVQDAFIVVLWARNTNKRGLGRKG